jgi:hypothetical protein
MTQTPTTATTIPVVTEAEADAYFATTPRNDAWLAITPATLRPLMLTEAERWLRGLCPNPDAVGCCGDFATQWTIAVSELALALKLSPAAVISGVASAGAAGEVKLVKLGDLQQEFYQPREGQVVKSGRYGPRAPYILQAFPWLGDLIGYWLPSFGGRMIPVERN